MANDLEKAEHRILCARANLILYHPFFGALASRLDPVADDQQPPWSLGFYTDYKIIGYDPAKVLKYTLPQVCGAHGHEVLHNALGDNWRMLTLPIPPLPKETPPELAEKIGKALRHEKANRAADYRINAIVKEAGMELPPGHLSNAAYDGMSLEEIYAKLPDPRVEFVGEGGFTIEHMACGGIHECPGNEEEQRQVKSDWQVAVTQAAAAARAQDRLPAGLERLVGTLLRPRQDVRAILMRFMQQACRNDYSWRKPSPRYLPSGLYLPCLYSEEMGPVVWGIDTSGSMDQDELQKVCGWANEGIVQCKPARSYVAYCDTVAKVDVFEQGEPVVFRPVGGGGTDFRPVFEYVEEHAVEPVCLIYLTDLCGTFPDKPPDYPVLWVTTTDQQAPWGETVRLE